MIVQGFERPKDKKELQMLEAVGAIRASRFVTRFANSKTPITQEIVYEIQKEMYSDWWPENAGKIRAEEIHLWHSKHLPPHHSQIVFFMKAFSEELAEQLVALEPKKLLSNNDKDFIDEFQKVIAAAAWAHHKIVWIHPFVDGNGRTARLMSNLILKRYGLWAGLSARIERENKDQYLEALTQADDFNDYDPLEKIIAEGLAERYERAPGLRMWL